MADRRRAIVNRLDELRQKSLREELLTRVDGPAIIWSSEGPSAHGRPAISGLAKLLWPNRDSGTSLLWPCPLVSGVWPELLPCRACEIIRHRPAAPSCPPTGRPAADTRAARRGSPRRAGLHRGAMRARARLFWARPACRPSRGRRADRRRPGSACWQSLAARSRRNFTALTAVVPVCSASRSLELCAGARSSLRPLVGNGRRARLAASVPAGSRGCAC